jgi:hypothetical protein
MTATATVASPPLIPPEEKFWQRYSPHNEAPLSGVTSTIIHALVLGLLLLVVYVHHMTKLDDANRPLPVDVIKFVSGKTGQPGAGGIRPGGGDEIDREGGGQNRTAPMPPPIIPLKPADVQGVLEQFPDDPNAKYYLSQGKGSAPAFDFFGLEKEARQTLRKGLQPGMGGGPGKEKAVGRGDGFPSLDERVARALRWDITFKTSNGSDYLAQLAGLGARIGIPVEGREGQYLLVNDLRNPMIAQSTDVSSLGLMYWIDSKPQSVQSLYSVVPHHQPNQPSYFVAFFPRRVEDRLLDLEMDFAARKYNFSRKDENKIHLTKFTVIRSGGSYDVRVDMVYPKP